MRALHWSNLQETELAELLGVAPSTLRRWCRGTQEPPTYAVRYARLLILRELEMLDPDWHGWRLERGRLVGPHANLHFTPGELLLWPSLWAAARRGERREPVQRELF